MGGVAAPDRPRVLITRSCQINSPLLQCEWAGGVTPLSLAFPGKVRVLTMSLLCLKKKESHPRLFLPTKVPACSTPGWEIRWIWVPGSPALPAQEQQERNTHHGVLGGIQAVAPGLLPRNCSNLEFPRDQIATGCSKGAQPASKPAE